VVISKRERYIGIGAAAAVGLAVLNSLVISPYFDRRDEIDTDLAKINQKLSDDDQLFIHQRQLRPTMTSIEQHGLKTDLSDAQSQFGQAVNDWVENAGLSVANYRPEQKAQQQGRFQVIVGHFTVNGPLYPISRLLWSTETAGIPLRVNDMQISPRHEGTDDLTVQLTLSTICMVPPAIKPAAHPAAVTDNSQSHS
jgi:hypothetical protein